jgi:predicted membrane-bound mannosyltransferase
MPPVMPQSSNHFYAYAGVSIIIVYEIPTNVTAWPIVHRILGILLV